MTSVLCYPESVMTSDTHHNLKSSLGGLEVETILGSRSSLAANQKRRRRLFDKRGNNRATFRNLSRFVYVRDLFHTVIDIKWRYLIAIYIFTYILTWTFFGTLWWLLMFLRGDFEHLVGSTRAYEDGYVPCVNNAFSWEGCFLFSLETQTTIGYGLRVISEECGPGYFILNCQFIVAKFLEACVLCTVLAKVGRSKMRSATLRFSQSACIETTHDGQLCFTFRVADLRANTNLAGVNIRVYCIPTPTLDRDITHRATDFNIIEMDYEMDKGLDRLFLPTPLLVKHVINSFSPLYQVSETSLGSMDNFEIVVILEGSVVETGKTEQFRTSYVPEEILWGYSFVPCGYIDLSGRFTVDYSKFEKFEIVDIGSASAAERDEFTRL